MLEHLIFQSQRLSFASGLIFGLAFQTNTFRNFTSPGLAQLDFLWCYVLVTDGVGPFLEVILKPISSHVY